MPILTTRPVLLSIALVSFICLGTESTMAWDGGKHRENEREDAMHFTPDLENGKKLYGLCAKCHKDDGWGIASGFGNHSGDGYYPILAGQHQKVLIKQLADIRSGNRDNPMMYPFTLDKYIGGPKDIADVTGYIASMPVNPNNEYGFGDDLEHGKKLYEEHCVSCHGDYGEGSNEEFYPRIQGQHYTYMLRQMKWIKNGKRRNANKKMAKQIEGFTYRDMKAVIDYVSRLKPATEEVRK